MRIPESRQVNAARKSSKNGRTSSAGSVFSLPEAGSLPQTAMTQQAGMVQAVGDISSLLAVQSVDVDEGRAVAINRGFETLDALDDLKIDVLCGNLSRQKMLHLAKLVENERAGLSDPVLIDILDHIELRARVELAKFERTHFSQ